MSVPPTVLIFGNQLRFDHPGLQPVDGQPPRVLMIESWVRLRSRPYHKQKLILILSAMRHFAHALRMRGYVVDYRAAPTIAEGVRVHLAEHEPGGLLVMQPAEYRAQQALSHLFDALNATYGAGFARVLPDTMFLCSREAFVAWAGLKKSLRLEHFYRWQRRRLAILMDGNEPVGGQWNFDAANRQPPPAGGLLPPPLPAVPLDEITRAVIDQVQHEFSGNFGVAEPFIYPVTHADAAAWLADFVTQRLPQFGPYEDAMVAGEPFLFHSVLSPLVNIGLLSPAQMVEAAVAAYQAGRAPLASVEGFVRQVIGWREFVHGIYWLKMPDYAKANHFAATGELPAFLWSGDTAMACLADLVTTLRHTAYTHHIPRLMLASNFATLAGVRPQALLEWFQALYIDAFDWVMLPNVFGLGMYADGGLLATKPYIASANYIRRMSHGYCNQCHYQADARLSSEACPFNFLYWDFIARHQAEFLRNPRMALIAKNLAQQDPVAVETMRSVAATFLDNLPRA